MNAKKAKALRKRIAKEWVKLYQAKTPKLLPFSVIWRRAKEVYNNLGGKERGKIRGEK